MKIKNLLILSFTCFAIIPMIIFGVILSQFMSSNASSQSNELMTSIVTNQEQVFIASVDSMKTEAQGIAKLAEAYGDNKNAAVEESISKNPYIDFAVFTDSSYSNLKDGTFEVLSGRQIASSEKLSELKKALGGDTQNGPGVEIPDISALPFDELYVYTTKSLVIKEQAGDTVLMLFYNTDFYKTLYSNSRFLQTNTQAGGKVSFADPNGRIIEGEALTKSLTVDAGNEYNDPAVSSAIASSNGSVVIKTLEKSTKTAAIKTIPAIGWTVISIIDNNMLSINAALTSGVNVATILLLSILFIVLAILAAKFLLKPFDKIKEAFVKISRGDHDTRVDIVALNEYGEIARLFNDLMDDIVVSESRYRNIIEMSDSIIFEWNFKTNEVVFSNNYNKKFSYRAPSDHFGDSFLLKAQVHKDDEDRYRRDLESLGKGAELNNEYRIKNIYGDYIWFLIRTATLKDRSGNPVKVVGTIVDIDRAKKSEEELTARASFDSLTNLYNRETVVRQIDNEIQLSAVRKSEMAILFVDVDDFKDFNDKYSHATGDLVLQFVANSIRDAVGDFGFAGRYGGDEFLVCIRNSEINNPTKIAHQLLTKFSEGFTSEGVDDTLVVKASIGIAIVKDTSAPVDKIIALADDAMYKIKKSGKSNYGYF